HNMPIPVARKIDFFNRTRNLGLDVRLIPVVLTPAQCIEYELPRTPLKETAGGKERFEERFGAGATELDALEALRPGVLRQIVVENIRRYHDRDIGRRVREAADAFREELDEAHREVVGRHEQKLQSLRDRREEIDARFTSDLQSIFDRCNQVIE